MSLIGWEIQENSRHGLVKLDYFWASLGCPCLLRCPMWICLYLPDVAILVHIWSPGKPGEAWMSRKWEGDEAAELKRFFRLKKVMKNKKVDFLCLAFVHILNYAMFLLCWLVSKMAQWHDSLLGVPTSHAHNPVTHSPNNLFRVKKSTAPFFLHNPVTHCPIFGG